ncbi:MAG: hypothetical protein RLZZ385_1078 [Pseudomonadota bacterium]
MPKQSFFGLTRRLWVTMMSLLAVSLLLVWGILFKLEQDRASRELALAVVEATMGQWQADPLLAVAHPDLRGQMSDDDWQTYVESLSVLGPLQAMETISGAARVPLLPFLTSELTAEYRIDMRFAYAPAWATLSLRRETDAWWITDFTVRSGLTDN